MMEMDQKRILESWHNWSLENKLPIKPVRSLQEQDINVIKAGITRSVWRINVPLTNGAFPVILKIYHGNKTFKKFYEWKVYQQLENTALGDFLPEFYEIKVVRDKSEVWIFTEYLDVFEERQTLTPAHLYKITSRLAELHATTFEHQKIADLIRHTIPEYQTAVWDERLAYLKRYLMQAKLDPALSHVIDQYCPEIDQLTQLDLSFPELMDSGRCLTHGDLHLGNVCFDHEDKKIKFIDLGVATYSPCWLDLVKLVETAIDSYFEKGQSEIREACIRIYVKEMKKQGITFSEEAGRLYRLAYLKRVFEKELRRNLRATLKGKRPFESDKILGKISMFSKDLYLIRE